MRIGIDARMLGWSGVGRYTENLIEGLKGIDKENEYVIFREAPFAPFSFGEQLFFPLVLRKRKIDLFHCPHFLNPLLGVRRMVLTVHDLIPLHFPEHFSSKERFYFYQVLKRGIKRARKVIAVSEHTKRDILNNFEVKREKIRVIPNAVSKIFHPLDSRQRIEEFKEKHSIDKPYLLYVGNRKAHKNLDKLFQVFRLVQEKSKNNYLLVIASPSPREAKHSGKKSKEKEADPLIRFLDNTSDEELCLLYNGAELFVFPSLYEGFGLPPLEAMACATPVISSNATSLPEVVGEAAVMVNPQDEEEMAENVLNLLSDDGLRKVLIEKGLARAKLFSLERLARETLKVYREAA